MDEAGAIHEKPRANIVTNPLPALRCAACRRRVTPQPPHRFVFFCCGGQIGWVSTPQVQEVKPALATVPPNSPDLAVPPSTAGRSLPLQDKKEEGFSEVIRSSGGVVRWKGGEGVKIEREKGLSRRLNESEGP